jgi:hypothetical protein
MQNGVLQVAGGPAAAGCVSSVTSVTQCHPGVTLVSPHPEKLASSPSGRRTSMPGEQVHTVTPQSHTISTHQQVATCRGTTLVCVYTTPSML